MDDLILRFPPPAQPLSMNAKDNRETGRAKQAWRDTAYYLYIEAHPGVGPAGRRRPPSEVYVTLPFTLQRERDAVNYARTVKAIVDGITRAGAWPRDTDEFVTQNLPTLVQGAEVTVRIADRKQP